MEDFVEWVEGIILRVKEYLYGGDLLFKNTDYGK